MKAVVVGLGLIGGSLALNLMKNKFISTVYGCDLDKNHEKKALELKLVHEIADESIFKECDIIFLCVPVGAIISIAKKLTNIPKTPPSLSLVAPK